MKSVVVIASHRSIEFLDAWKATDLVGSRLIVVQDSPVVTFRPHGAYDMDIYSWKEIDANLQERAWIIPRQCGVIRSYGMYKAWQENPDLIITLDDDCYPVERTQQFVAEHWKQLSVPRNIERWVNTIDDPDLYARGYPYALRKTSRTMVNIGLWEGVPDIDARTTLRFGDVRDVSLSSAVVRKSAYAPLCSMNVAFRPEVTPAYYQLLMGLDKYGFDRYGDIWSGIFLKKILDHLGGGMVMGRPHVLHQRASSVHDNLRKEQAMHDVNESLWAYVDGLALTGTDFKSCYAELGRHLAGADLPRKEYFATLATAMGIWTTLFDQEAGQ